MTKNLNSNETLFQIVDMIRLFNVTPANHMLWSGQITSPISCKCWQPRHGLVKNFFFQCGWKKKSQANEKSGWKTTITNMKKLFFYHEKLFFCVNKTLSLCLFQKKCKHLHKFKWSHPSTGNFTLFSFAVAISNCSSSWNPLNDCLKL